MVGIETMGQRIRAAREAAGMTQKELAERARVSLSTIGKLEHDSWDARLHVLNKVAYILDCKLIYLLFGGRGLWARVLDVWPPWIGRLEIVKIEQQLQAAKEGDDDGQADAD